MGVAARVEHRQVRRFYGGSDAMFARPRPDPTKPPGSDLLPQIQHIVLLMMENHSFDNYLGTLGHGLGLPLDADGHPQPLVQDDGTELGFWRDGTTTQCVGSPTQSWHASHLQYANGTNRGFRHSVKVTVPNATADQLKAPLRYWTDEDLPFYTALARTFALADHWFCSCLGPTFPNRRFLLAGTADGLIDDLPFGMVGYPKAGTIFDLLTRNHIHWVNYHAVSKTGVLTRRLFGRHILRFRRRLLAAVGKLVPTLLRATLGDLQFTADLYPLGFFGAVGHLRSHDEFFAEAASGALPPVSLVDPDFTACSEEEPAGHRARRAVRGPGHRRGHARAGVAAHPVDLVLRRARRLLRQRPATRSGGAGRQARPQPARQPRMGASDPAPARA